ncbi:granulocyte colony-stimulating factor receptor-like [Sinocyclocheilus anshuiensis]|uniref:granulocyte colony-stimulating factor receptor-like n=1 Tax=Sinocyclocheilus anshuiensis TaxID=1608454 RepID=UPI0007BA6681|nr:PREDICTED: granulocyte colony-stimulating factor receptor-like [Sinocyclocheilus anshuiensis]XP_016305947.1 PREDICTED: granulocyte colony-stimulating factor receptor-like [Sinocyclocheilus anshuiensis]
MASVWLVLVLWIFVNALIKVIQGSSCAKIHTPASVVLAGSPVSVSCSIEDDCPLTKSKDFRVAWKINNHFAPSNLSYQESSRTYGVIIPSLPDTDTFIACAVCEEENCQIVNGVQVKAGYPPSVPKNLSCSLNLTSKKRFLCQWDPGQEMANLATKYTLHIFRVMSKKVTCDQYLIPSGAHFYLIPRQSYALLSEVEINVTAVNVLGNATSETLKLIPMETVMFDPPEINRIEADVVGCLNYSWSLAKSQQWLTTAISLELSLKTVNNQQNKELVLLFTKNQGSKLNVCDLFHGTNYSTTMRVKYSSLSKWSKWSEWSDPKIATTVMKAPTGSLDTWLKVDDQNAQLYWKPLENFHANGWNLFYTVESKEPKNTFCVTQESHCFFSITEKVEKVFLRATNAVSSSDHTEVPVYRNKGLGSVSNFSVHPQSEMSVLIAWGGTPASLNVTGYVLEWRSLCETPSPPLSFTLMDKNISSTIITGLKPYKPYEMSIYPKYDKGIGIPHTLVAYSSQKAPSVAPVLNFMEIRHSYVKLHWNEIPLEQRNGIIQGYTVYFWNELNNIKVIKTEETSIVVRDLQPHTKYEALLTVHTRGGSLNGSVVALATGHMDGIEMVLFVIPACLGLSLLAIVVFAYIGKHERVKMCLWPIIPDPANSSIKRWTTTDSMQGIPPFKEDKKPVLVYLSHFSLLDLDEKEPFKSDYFKENQWSHDIDSCDESHSSFQTSVRHDSEHDRDSVPYATVVFSGPYQNHSSCPPAYVRSESTQPLLGADDAGSPPPYENVSPSSSVSKVQRFTTFPQNSIESEENEELYEEFPMLRSLELRDTDHI